jgi:predicted XRE-type DNA-binding protein
MKNEPLDVIRGSGNIFRDFGHANADVEQFKALLAAEIIKALDRDKLTVRAAHARTGIAAADFSRIRNADLARFTLDRLVGIINRLGSRVEVNSRSNRCRARRTRRSPNGIWGRQGSDTGRPWNRQYAVFPGERARGSALFGRWPRGDGRRRDCRDGDRGPPCMRACR